MANFNVSLKKLTEKVSLDVVYTPKGLEEINVEIAEVNRPGLFLAGYYDYFDKLRLQILGLAEMNFLSGLSAEKRYERLDQLFGQQLQNFRMRLGIVVREVVHGLDNSLSEKLCPDTVCCHPCEPWIGRISYPVSQHLA